MILSGASCGRALAGPSHCDTRAVHVATWYGPHDPERADAGRLASSPVQSRRVPAPILFGASSGSARGASLGATRRPSTLRRGAARVAVAVSPVRRAQLRFTVTFAIAAHFANLVHLCDSRHRRRFSSTCANHVHIRSDRTHARRVGTNVPGTAGRAKRSGEGPQACVTMSRGRRPTGRTRRTKEGAPT